MQCPACRYENPTAVKFCGECGTRLEARCPGCGAANPPSNKFCHECGASLTAQPPKFTAPSTYKPKHGIELQIRVGLNSGDVVVRSIGSDLRMDYTAVGQTTHLAARMEQLAPPGTVRLSAETLALVEGYVDVKPLGPIPVKGLAAPVDVYELSGAVMARTRLQAARA